MKKWRVIEKENIADLDIEVYGKDESDLLKNILQAFTSLTADIGKLREVEELKNLEIKGDNFEEIVFNFVEKLVYFKDAKSLLFKKGRFKINDRKIIADLSGQKITPDLPVRIDIKALTRHKFKVTKGRRYKAALVFDI